MIISFRCHWKARCAGTARMLRWRFESYPLTELCFPQPIWETREKKTSSASQYASASDTTRTMEQRHVTNLLPVKENVWPGDKALPYDLFSSALKLLIGVSWLWCSKHCWLLMLERVRGCTKAYWQLISRIFHTKNMCV